MQSKMQTAMMIVLFPGSKIAYPIFRIVLKCQTLQGNKYISNISQQCLWTYQTFQNNANKTTPPIPPYPTQPHLTSFHSTHPHFSSIPPHVHSNFKPHPNLNPNPIHVTPFHRPCPIPIPYPLTYIPRAHSSRIVTHPVRTGPSS